MNILLKDVPRQCWVNFCDGCKEETYRSWGSVIKYLRQKYNATVDLSPNDYDRYVLEFPDEITYIRFLLEWS